MALIKEKNYFKKEITERLSTKLTVSRIKFCSKLTPPETLVSENAINIFLVCPTDGSTLWWEKLK